MNLNEITTQGFILALFIRDDSQRFLLGSGAYEFKEDQLHFSANSMSNDVVEVQGNDGYMLAGQVRRPTTQVFDGYIGDASVNRAEVENYRRDFFAFFQKNHFYTVIYIFPNGSAIQRRRGFIVDCGEVKELYQLFPEYHIGMNFEDVNYYKYNEDSDGHEIYGKSAIVGLSTDMIGGLVWEQYASGKNMYAGSQDFSGVWANSSKWTSDSEDYNGLSVKKNSNAWNGLYKEITVESGKTYTFSVYAKADETRGVAIYLGGGSATVEPQSYAFNITDEWGRYYLTFTATSSGSVRARIENTSAGVITYICGYQLEESPTMTDYEIYTGGNKIGGVEWDSDGAVWEDGGGGMKTVSVDSIENVYPVWKVVGPTNNPTLENITTGTTISYSGNVASGQTLVVDMLNETAKLNGTSVIGNISGKWLEFAPGNNTISYTATNSTAPDSTIEWQEIVG